MDQPSFSRPNIIRLFLLIPANMMALLLGWFGLQARVRNILGWFLVLLAAAYLVGSLFFFLRSNSSLIARMNGVQHEEKGDRSFWLVLPGFVLVFFAAPTEYLYLRGQGTSSFIWQMIGLVLISFGVVLRIWTRVTLKHQYTGHIQIVEGKNFQTGGPYRYVRHPGYAAFLLVSLGLAIGFRSCISGCALFYVLLPGLYYRMMVEEDLLTQQFGDAYLQYAVRTPRIIPGLF